MGRDSILVLFAPAGIDHRLEKTAPAELHGVPGRPWQRTDDRGRQHDAGGCFVHGVVSLEALLRTLAPTATLNGLPISHPWVTCDSGLGESAGVALGSLPWTQVGSVEGSCRGRDRQGSSSIGNGSPPP